MQQPPLQRAQCYVHSKWTKWHSHTAPRREWFENVGRRRGLENYINTGISSDLVGGISSKNKGKRMTTHRLASNKEFVVSSCPHADLNQQVTENFVQSSEKKWHKAWSSVAAPHAIRKAFLYTAIKNKITMTQLTCLHFYECEFLDFEVMMWELFAL